MDADVRNGPAGDEAAEAAPNGGAGTQEEGAGALRERLAAAEGELARVRGLLAEVERAREVERALAEAQAVDVEAAGMLLEKALAGGKAGGGKGDGAAGGAGGPRDIAGAVRELRRRKPHLFKGAAPGAPGGAASAMSGRVREGSRGGIEAVAEEAAATGDRRVVMRYLRMRRGG